MGGTVGFATALLEGLHANSLDRIRDGLRTLRAHRHHTEKLEQSTPLRMEAASSQHRPAIPNRLGGPGPRPLPYRGD